jgi:hypothetical protein
VRQSEIIVDIENQLNPEERLEGSKFVHGVEQKSRQTLAIKSKNDLNTNSSHSSELEIIE